MENKNKITIPTEEGDLMQKQTPFEKAFEKFDTLVAEMTGLSYCVYSEQAEVMNVIPNDVFQSMSPESIAKGFVQMFNLKTPQSPGFENVSEDTLRRVNAYHASLYDYASAGKDHMPTSENGWVISVDGNIYQNRDDKCYRLSIGVNKETGECAFEVSKCEQPIHFVTKGNSKSFIYNAPMEDGKPAQFEHVASGQDIGDVMDIVVNARRRACAPKMEIV